MKKFLLLFLLTIVEFGRMVASGPYNGIVVTSTNLHKRYLLSESPLVKYVERDGVKYAVLYINNAEKLNIPLANGEELQATYGEYLPTVTLNPKGYATYSSHVNVDIFTDRVKAYKAEVNGEIITLTELEGYIPAGNGFLLFGNDMAGTVIDFMEAKASSSADLSGNSLLATTLRDGILAEKPENAWALGPGQQFLRYTGATFVHNRAYLIHEKTSQVQAMNLIFEDDPTGIESILGNTSSFHEMKVIENGHIYIVKNGVKYNMAGQMMKNQ